MMNRFQFRAPPPNPVLNAGSGKSGLGATTINKPKPRPPPSEDLWGDLDDDFLVQASQVAEQLQQAHAASVVTEEERMEMDEEVLTMFIQEEEKLESLPPPRKPAPPKPVRLYAEPVKPQPKVRLQSQCTSFCNVFKTGLRNYLLLLKINICLEVNRTLSSFK